MVHKYIVWIILSIIIIMSAVAFLIQSNTQNKITPSIINELIIPYKNHIKNRDYEKAYSELTSMDYKSKYTYEQYRKAQDSNYILYGILADLKPLSGVFLKETSTGNKTVFKATFGYLGKKKHQRIIIDVVKENGKYKIFNTYNSYVSIGGLLSVIY